MAVVAGLVTAAGALRGGESAAESAAAAGPTAEAHRYGVMQSGEVAHPVAATTPARAESLGTTPATAPAIAHGRTDLAAGIYAERVGDTIVVTFDTEATRTRRSDKFENVVRETLPVVLGDTGREAVRRMAAGSLVPPGQLLPALDGAPLAVPVGDGRILRIQPQARPGRDGPLVIAYRVVIDLAAPSPAS